MSASSIVKRQKVLNGVDESLVSPYGANVNGGSGSGSGTLMDNAIVLEGHTGSVLTGSFSSTDGRYIATGGLDKTINLWNLPMEGNSSLPPNYLAISGHKSAITCLKWSIDDSNLITSSADTTLGYWDSITGKRVRKCSGHDLCVNQVAFVDGVNVCVSSGDDGYLLLWDFRTKDYVGEFKSEYPLLTCITNNAKDTVYCSGIDPTIYAIDLKKFPSELWVEQTTHKDYISSLCVSKDDSILISRSNDNTLRAFDCKKFVPQGLKRFKPSFIYDGSISGNENLLIGCKISPNGLNLIAGGADKTLTVWELQSKKLISKLSGHNGSVIDVDYHPTVPVVLSTSTDGTCIVREL
ncbi:hypothetical protein PACTADRAFT_47964 [Pachysolen tannophilus NRRL Y-2460]|uniref:Uncharacterized protein n=1 Tax=Pachysolen tannophilus NRRL Y-2460 TaxID=669874 RepID=A0A1E4U2D9_PACTA|nr:hypothetical protein PACTADRAFT_47964 [Pachysolen tannophilus NRRL Y-2460]